MGPPAALGPCFCSRPGASCGRYHGGQRRRPARCRRPQPLTGATGHPVPAFRGSLPGHGRADGPGARSGRSWTAGQPGAANDRERAGSPAGPGSRGEGHSELKHGGPQGKTEGQSGQAAPGGGQTAGHFPRYPAKRRTGPGARHDRGSSVANCAIFDPRSRSRRGLREHMFYLSRPFCRFPHGGCTSDPRSRACSDRDLPEIRDQNLGCAPSASAKSTQSRSGGIGGGGLQQQKVTCPA